MKISPGTRTRFEKKQWWTLKNILLLSKLTLPFISHVLFLHQPTWDQSKFGIKIQDGPDSEQALKKQDLLGTLGEG